MNLFRNGGRHLNASPPSPVFTSGGLMYPVD